MARPRKNAAKAQSSLLTVDGVQEDVIPVEEQPYPLPEGWKWVTLGDVVSVSKEKTEDFSSPSLRYIGLEHLEKGYGIIGFASVEGIRSLKNIFHPGQILYGKLRPYLNKHDIVDFPGVCSTDILVFSCKDGANNKFINYFFNLNHFKEYAVANSKGINLPRVSEQVVLNAFFPLPPFDDQQRIVDRIESLFAKLDEAREKAEAVLDGFESRKAAILHKAFTGELTAKWREEKGITLTDWKNLTLNDIAEYRKGPFGSSITKAMFVPKGKDTYKVYEQGNAIRKTLSYGNYYISKEKFNELSSFSVEEGDIIISCAGTIGETYKLPYGSEKGVINQALMRVRVYSNTDERFFEYYFSGILKGDVIDKANGTAIKNIPPFKVMKAMPIHLPLLSEQREIICLLDSLLEKEQQAKEAAEIVLEQITVMKKAILARAFRGELTGPVHN